MTTRRINWTGRRRITRKEARILLRREGGLRFELVLDVATLSLPPDALVQVEAYAGAFVTRFDFGTVGLVRVPASTELTDFEDLDQILFRVKVLGVGPLASRILAEADQLRPFDPDEELSHRRPLLEPRGAELGEIVWRLEIDETKGPDFQLNKTLGVNWKDIARTPQFVWLVLPEVLRQILEVAVKADAEELSDDSWQRKWLLFAEAIPGAPREPEDVDDEQASEWASDVVAAFCRRHRMRDNLLRHLLAGDA